jgi:hypothetical protein
VTALGEDVTTLAESPEVRGGEIGHRVTGAQRDVAEVALPWFETKGC